MYDGSVSIVKENKGSGIFKILIEMKTFKI